MKKNLDTTRFCLMPEPRVCDSLVRIKYDEDASGVLLNVLKRVALEEAIGISGAFKSTGTVSSRLMPRERGAVFFFRQRLGLPIPIELDPELRADQQLGFDLVKEGTEPGTFFIWYPGMLERLEKLLKKYGESLNVVSGAGQWTLRMLYEHVNSRDWVAVSLPLPEK